MKRIISTIFSFPVVLIGYVTSMYITNSLLKSATICLVVYIIASFAIVYYTGKKSL